MIDKEISAINEVVIRQLITNEVFESKTLDYKREINIETEAGKKEFLADVCSFANAEGGDLVIGIDEKNGLPIEITGIHLDNPDAFQQKINNMIRDGIEPHISYTTKCIKLTNDKYVVVIRIYKGFQTPHRVCYQSPLKFYSRNSTGKYIMDMSELRSAFSASYDIIKRAEHFRDNRISQIYHINEVVEDENYTPLLIVHILPMNSFTTPLFYELNKFEHDTFLHYLRPIHYSRNLKGRWNYDGFLVYGQDENSCSYTQLYRNGCIEIVDQLLWKEQNSLKSILSYENEVQIVRMLQKKYIPFLKSLNVTGSLFVFISMLNIKGFLLSIPYQIKTALEEHEQFPLTQNSLFLKEALIKENETEVHKCLQPCFDIFWNAFGFERDYCFPLLKL